MEACWMGLLGATAALVLGGGGYVLGWRRGRRYPAVKAGGKDRPAVSAAGTPAAEAVSWRRLYDFLRYDGSEPAAGEATAAGAADKTKQTHKIQTKEERA